MEIKAKEITLFPTAKLSHYPKNVNKHTDEQIDRLVELIEYHGHRDPLIVDADIQPDGTHWVMAGNGRLQAAKREGWEFLPVMFQVFKSEDDKYSFMVSHNAIGASSWGGGLDFKQINLDLADLGPINIDHLGIKDFVVEPLEKFEPQADEDEVPEVVHPITRRGDIWLLGNHRLMCGDSTMIDDVEKLMNGEKAELVFTDPPYRMEAEGGSNQLVGKAARKLGEAIKHLCDFDPEAFLQTIPVVFDKNKMNSYIFCNKDLVPDYLKWGVDCGYSFNILFWKKPNAIPLGGSHRPDVEYLLLFRKSAKWNNGLKDVNYSKCLEFGRVKDKEQSGGHPTPKPVELIDNEIKISSDEKDIVVDFFGGSGSTLISCEKNKRRAFLMELDEKFVDVIIKRWEKYTGKKAVLELTNQTYEELKAERCP